MLMTIRALLAVDTKQKCPRTYPESGLEMSSLKGGRSLRRKRARNLDVLLVENDVVNVAHVFVASLAFFVDTLQQRENKHGCSAVRDGWGCSSVSLHISKSMLVVQVLIN